MKRLAADGRLVLTRRVCSLFPTESAAPLAALEALTHLRPSNFAHSTVLAAYVADVYGLLLEAAGWYLKVTIADDATSRSVVVISFHPLEQPLATRGGVVMP